MSSIKHPRDAEDEEDDNAGASELAHVTRELKVSVESCIFYVIVRLEGLGSLWMRKI